MEGETILKDGNSGVRVWKVWHRLKDERMEKKYYGLDTDIQDRGRMNEEISHWVKEGKNLEFQVLHEGTKHIQWKQWKDVSEQLFMEVKRGCWMQEMRVMCKQLKWDVWGTSVKSQKHDSNEGKNS